MKRPNPFGIRFWLIFAIGVTALVLRVHQALAGDPKFWGDYPPEVHAWFPTVMQPGFEDMHDAGHSCCGVGDAYEARIIGEDAAGDIMITIDDGKLLIPDGTTVSAPRSKIQTHYGNPFPDKVIVFMNTAGGVYCLIPNTGI